MVVKKTKLLNNVSIIGDSFSVIDSNLSWASLLANDYNVNNFSQRGISEYRLYKIINDNFEIISKSDVIIIFHTNLDRIFIPDDTLYPSRKLNTHLYCDMLASDSLTHNNWKHIAEIYYKNFFDYELQLFFYKCIIEQINKLLEKCNVIHCSGFNSLSTANLNFITSFCQIRSIHPGNINHYDQCGNFIVYNSIKQMLSLQIEGK